jgi:hypothetical protein
MSFEFNGHEIKAITIKQPYASLIINGIQNVENRSWSKKIHKDECKNWLFVHASSKYASKKEVKKINNIPDNLEYPSSCIIGMIHINCIGKLLKSVCPSCWESGPNCWYIDAVIKFDTHVSTDGHLGQWDPDKDIHNDLTKQIESSMYNIVPIDDIKFVDDKGIYYAVQRGKYMTWNEVIKSLRENIDTFVYKLIQFFIGVKYKAYFWECDKVMMNKPFRFAIFDSKTLANRKQDNKAFNGVINCKKDYAISFPSLSKNIDLVVPCNRSSSTKYTSLATFSRTSLIKQQVDFWMIVGNNIKDGDWVSTSGLGVAWLHVRISDRPKYYHDAFDKNPKKVGREYMEEYIENFNFPKNFVNVIVYGKDWKKDVQMDMIMYYLELLPNDTKVLGAGTDLEGMLEGIKLRYEIFSTDWKKYGRYGKFEKNKEMLDQHVDLVTVFGNEEEDLIQYTKSKKIQFLQVK